MNGKLNPFNITKAVDLTDEQIKNLWVDIGLGNGLNAIVKPTSPMPMMILGGKGSGKTHLMRYCSFQLQKIRNSNIINNIQEEGYVGIFMRCSGLNSNKFTGKNQTEDTWNTIFSYYMELWLGQLVLEILDEIFQSDNELSKLESSICSSILNLLDVEEKIKENTIKEIINLLVSYRKQVDFSVNNSALTGKLDGFKVNITSGNLIFGVPKIIVENIAAFKGIQFLYLIDEFENLNEQQQKYINTLYREKELPTSFKIGARLYGFKTKKTFSADEENKEDSEFETFKIDDYFRKSEKYEAFVKNLCIKRIIQYGYLTGFDANRDLDSFDKQFEIFNFNDFYKNYIVEFSGTERPYFQKLKRKLEINKIDNAEMILDLLRAPENPLIERTNIFLFYRSWKSPKTKDLLISAQEINQETKEYLHDKSIKGLHFKILDKFKTDIEDQLILESGRKLYYSGIKTFVQMSFGIPRNLLKILKHIFYWSNFHAESPFNGGIIKIDSQIKGIKDAAEWFFEDARTAGKDGKQVKNAISRLAQFLREIRFSDLPPECSLCAFTLNISELDDETSNIIELSEKCSYIIKVGTRHEKNSKRIDPVYQINGLLAPKWDLPIYKRGEISISKEEAKAIFNPEDDVHFNKILKERLNNYNVPFRKGFKSPQTSFL